MNAPISCDAPGCTAEAVTTIMNPLGAVDACRSHYDEWLANPMPTWLCVVQVVRTPA